MISARCALGQGEKRSILVAEVDRRLRNCYREMEWREKAKLVVEYCRRMYRAGHTERFRVEVASGGISKYLTSLQNDKDGTSIMYRTAEERDQYWARQGGRPTAANWAKKRGFGNTIKVQATAGGTLVKRIQGAMDKTSAAGGIRTKCVEDGGVSLRRALVRSDPSGIDRCTRRWCKICEVERVGGEKLEQVRVPCYMTNIAYGFKCMRAPCWDGEKSKSIYEGESSRSGSVRFGQHLDL